MTESAPIPVTLCWSGGYNFMLAWPAVPLDITQLSELKRRLVELVAEWGQIKLGVMEMCPDADAQCICIVPVNRLSGPEFRDFVLRAFDGMGKLSFDAADDRNPGIDDLCLHARLAATPVYP